MKTAILKKWAPCIALCAIVSAPAQSAVLFQGNAIGSFSNPLAGAGDYTKIWNHDAGPAYWYASTFEWGTVGSKKSCANGQCQNIPLPQTPSSQLAFDGIGSDAGDSGYTASLGSVFSLGTLKYTNMPTYFSEGVAGVDFSVGVRFGNLNAMQSFTYHAVIDNTWNVPANNPDTVAFSGPISPFQFSYAGNNYQFSLLGFSNDGGATFNNTFTVGEGQFIKTQLYGRFDTAMVAVPSNMPVPVPAALGLFGSGLIGLFGLGRRFKRT